MTRELTWDGHSYDISVVPPPSTSAEQAGIGKTITLKCATSPYVLHTSFDHGVSNLSSDSTCLFIVSATLKTFDSGIVAGQEGFGVNEQPFHCGHNHPPPYQPLNLDEENQRRKQLPDNDPSLARPPLQHAPPADAAPPPPKQKQKNPEEPLVQLIRSVNPSYIKYLPAIERLGMLASISLDELDEITEEDLRSMFEESLDIPQLVGVLLLKAIMRERNVRLFGVKDDQRAREAAKERGRQWVEAKIEEGRRMQAAR